MKVFLTGATGFIGTAIIAQLKGAGHTVLGLARSEEGAKALEAAGVEVHRGNIEDLDSLRSGATQADGVIHCGFNHDFSRFLQNCADDHAAIVAMGEVLAGTDKPFVITSGTAIADSVDGKPSTEDGPTSARNPRAASEAAVKELAGRGVNTSVVRLPHVTAVSKEKGVAAYRRREQPVAGGACVGRGVVVPAGAGEGGEGRDLPRGGRRGRDDEGGAGDDWQGAGRAGEEHQAGRGGGALRMAGDVCRARYAVVERDYAEETGLDAEGAGADCGFGGRV
jgi:nucleoside-diphosphate-sugar epimerase